MNRSYALPTIGALGVTLAACAPGDTIVGNWDLTSFTYDGDTTALPYSAEGATMTGTLAVTEALAATFTLAYTYEGQSDQTVLTGTATETEETAIFDLTLTYDGGDFTVTCDTTDDLLDCTGTPLAFEGARAVEE